MKHFKVAKNSIDPNKYHLVKAFSDIKILFISRLVLDLQIFFKTLSVSELRVNKPNSVKREQMPKYMYCPNFGTLTLSSDSEVFKKKSVLVVSNHHF
jgi:hypothetical protein